MWFQSEVLEYSPWMSYYGATLFTSSIISYGYVATLMWQFASHYCFPDFVWFLYPVIPIFPSLMFLLLVACQCHNITITFCLLLL